ncbi:MAG TPA: oxidoreductase [Acidisphaera sp.]|nr:oxidoreductase [Acidisphaera sp.]
MIAFTTADIPDLTGKRIVVTGATNGIGRIAATALAAKGASVILTGRDAKRLDQTVAAITRAHPTATVRTIVADQARLADVRALAGQIAADGQKLDVLLNNAGLVAAPKRQVTADGFEMQFGVNYLSHYLLTALLVPTLLRAPAPRVVTIASVAHKRARVDFDDLQSARSYDRMRAYAASKLENLIFALELDRRARAAQSPLMSVAAHPGISMTNIFAGAGVPGLLIPAFKLAGGFIGQSAEAGALPGLFAATSPAAQPGGYYGPQGWREMRGPLGEAYVAEKARDPAVAARLFEVSATLTGVPFPEFVTPST